MTLTPTSFGFALDLAAAAEVLNATPSKVQDMAHSGLLTPLCVTDPLSPARGLWFHPDDVSRAEVAMRKSTISANHRNRLRVLAALRDYLASKPPERRYNVAMVNNAPLLSKTRQREEVVNVRAEAVAAFGTERDGVQLSVSMTTATLEFLGALRVRGITAVDEPGRQRWGVWFRLPPGFLPGLQAADLAEVAQGFVSGALDEGDKVTRRGLGPAVVSGHLRGLDDSAADDTGTGAPAPAPAAEDDFDLDEEELAAEAALAAELANPDPID